MINVFSGGLIYEFSQEPNNYGLVEILPTNNVRLLNDYLLLKNQFERLPVLDHDRLLNGMRVNVKNIQKKLKSLSHALPECSDSYKNLDVSQGLPKPVGSTYLASGVQVEKGKYVEITEAELESPYVVFDVDGKLIYMSEPKVQRVKDTTSSWSSARQRAQGVQNCTYHDLFGDSSSCDDSETYEEEKGPLKSGNFFLSILSKVKKVLSRLKQAMT